MDLESTPNAHNAHVEVLSRHRLPQPYRGLLIVLWLLPLFLLVLALIYGHGMTLAVFDPRLLLIMGLMALPALYVWQEGVDVLSTGIVRRVYVPRYYAYADLHTWELAERRPIAACILTIWDSERQIVLAYHAAHLTGLPELVNALQTHLGEHPAYDGAEHSTQTRT